MTHRLKRHCRRCKQTELRAVDEHGDWQCIGCRVRWGIHPREWAKIRPSTPEADATPPPREQQRALAKRCRLPLPLVEAVLRGDTRDSDARTVAQRAHEEGWRQLVLAGRTNAGKSHALVWLAMHDVRRVGSAARSIPVLYVTAEAWASKPRFGPEAQRALDVVQSVPLLVLDELGREPHDRAGWWVSRLASVLDTRVNAGLRTAIGTPLTLHQALDRYGESTVKRIAPDDRWCELDGTWDAGMAGDGVVVAGPWEGARV